jgi:RNA polymerase sigma-B factor
MLVTHGLFLAACEARGLHGDTRNPGALRSPAAGIESIQDVTRDSRSANRLLVARLRFDRAVNRRQRAELERQRAEGEAQLVRLNALRQSLRRGQSCWTAKGTPPARASKAQSVAERHLDQLHGHYAATRDPKTQLELLRLYDRFALDLARRFPSRREQPEDLGQVARIGLLNALDRFEPQRERPFALFARATIVGELKRHIRDRTWGMRVPRALQERYLAVVQTADQLTQELGRSPRIDEVARQTGLSEEHVLEGMELGSAQHMMSLDAPPPDDDRTFDPGHDDAAFSRVERQVLLGALMSRIPAREREILRLRFELELTQTEIADRMGVSQMYISRLLGRTLARLRVLARDTAQ